MLKILLSILFIFEGLFGLMPALSINNSQNNEQYYSLNQYLGDIGEEENYTVTINFDSYTQTDVHLEKTCPNYQNRSQENSCAPMAGAIVITYHDILNTNLIPNYEPGSYYNNKFYFRGQNSTFNQMKEGLYTLMGTNSVQPGTSVSQFMSGMTSYVNDKGYNIAFNSCGSGFNLSTARNYLSLQQPLVLFLTSYIYHPASSITLNDTQMSMYTRVKNVGHAVVVYGYQEYNFYSNNQLFRTEKFLVTIFGDGTQGLLSINDTTGINEAYAINVY